jgi:large subunit ribosomal protein L18
MAYDRRRSLRRRHVRVRRKISGTCKRPRLCIHKSLKHLYAQVIDDTRGHTLCDATTNNKSARSLGKSCSNVNSARQLGAEVAVKALGKGVQTVVFDRSGYRYHGVIRAFGDAAREAGLKF